jgi:peptidyl-dipeptidase Dcp
VRKSRYDLDEAEVKPYFTLERMTAAMFDCAFQLFGLRFVLRTDIHTYHPDVKVYEVRETVDEEDKLVAIFLAGQCNS